jgi:predicted kinase
MSRIEVERFSASLDDPLLIFKVGVLGCAPMDLMSELADSYGAEYLASDVVRIDLVGEREEEGMPATQARKVDTREIKDRLAEGARAALADDQDVVLDMFCNTANSRRMPIDLAQEAGAKSIALWFNTPFSLAKQRVVQWTEEGAFLIPVGEWEVPPIVAAKRMMRHVERPSEIEGLDYVFDLKGIGETDAILDQYEARLSEAGLLGQYEDLGD